MELTISSILITLYYILIAFVILSILLDNRNPAKTAAYILILVFLPFFGLIVYIFFGQDYRKQKLFNLKGYEDNKMLIYWNNDHLSKNPDRALEDSLHQLLTNGSGIITKNNYITILKNGEEKFPALFKALNEATHHIHLEYYIIESDPLVAQIEEILIKKVNHGVTVRVVYDDVGSTAFKNKTIKRWKEKGIEIYPYMKVRYPFFTSGANYRDHRKIAIIDGHTGFVGGINLSERYVNKKNEPGKWRDTHLQLEGNCVKQLQLQFMLMWKFVSEETLPITYSYFPSEPTYKELNTQIVVSGPDSDYPNIMLSFFKLIANAKKTLYITTPYFIPNEQIKTAIISAALNQVDVKMIIPKNGDSKIVQAASMSYLKPLLKAGVRVFLYNNGFVHAKTMVVDNSICTIGTANMDVRSFNINFEINAFLFDKKMSSVLNAHFIEDLEHCEELFLNRWEKRPLTKRLIESTARLLAPLL